jgi:hypothetical protein
MRGSFHLGRRVIVAGLLLALGTVLAVARAQAGSAPLNFAYSGDAYGTFVRVGAVATSGPSFPAGLSFCTAKAGATSSNSGATSNVPGLLGTGTVTNTVSSFKSSSMGYARAASTVQNANVLNGLIKASAINAISRVNYQLGRGFTFANPSSVVGLTVAGHSVSVSPNTKVTIAGLGYVVVNEQSRSVTNGIAAQTVNMIHVVVTVSGNVYGLSPGTNIIVGHARAALSTPRAGGPVRGYSYGTRANVGTTLLSGNSAPASIPCMGGSSKNQIASVTLPKIGSTGTVVDTASAVVGSQSTTANATSSVQTVNLLSGLVRASAVRANVHGSFNGISHSFSDGSTFTSLTVNGHSVATVSANTVIKISNLGTLYLHRVLRTTNSYTVRMIELVVTTPNRYGLPVGADVQVGVANITFRD